MMAGNNNELDAFERQLKNSLDPYEVPYNSADWAQMERALSSGVRGWGYGRALVTGMLLAGALLIGGTAYFLGRDSGSHMADEQVGTATPTSMEVAVTGQADQGNPQAEPAPATSTTTAEPEAAPSTNLARKTGTATADRTVAGTTNRAGGSTPVNSANSGTQPGPNGNKANDAAASTGAGFRPSVKEACPGDAVEFTVERMSEGGIYLWNFGDGSFSNKPNPQHSFTKPGTYQVTLSMSSAGVGTIHNKPSSDMIVVHEAPLAAFNVIKREFAGQVPSVHFDSRTQGAKSYHWDLGDGTVSTLASPDHTYRKKGTYQVVLTVTNETGCEDRTMKEVRIDRDFDLAAPASFSPNGDGKNDSFMPQALPNLTTKFKLAVYDTAGTLMYSTTDASRPWCGKVHNQGALVAPGNYVWVVDLDAGQGTETFTGTVRLEK